jgi:MSHA biogenesis protein MshQ
MWNDGTTGKYNASLGLDGTNDSVDANTATSLDNVFVGGGTYSAWINATSFGENSRGRIVSKTGPSASSTGPAFFINNGDCTNCLSFYHDATSDGLWNTPSNSISTGSWIHVAVTFNKDSIDNTPTIYINGKPQTITESLDPTGSFTDDNTADLFIGNRPTDLDRTFNGLIDDVRVFNYTLSATQIKKLYNEGAGARFGPNTGSP